MKKITFLGIMILMSQLIFAQNVGWENYAKPEVIHDHVEMNNEIWFATNAGVIQINKNTLQKTNHNRASANIASNVVEGITKDNSNNLWIGTYAGVISKFDGTTWTNYDFNHLFPNNTQPIETYCIEADNQGIIWVGTEVGLLRFDGTNWQKYDDQNVDPMFGVIWAMTFDDQGDLFVASNHVFKFDGTTFSNISDTAGITLYGKADMLKDANGNIWVNNSFSTIGKFDGTNWDVYNYFNNQIPFGGAFTIGSLPNDDVYVTSNVGKYIFQNGTWVQDSIDNAIPLDENNLTTHFYDSQGTEWLANDDMLYQKNGSTITNLDLEGHVFDMNEFNTIEVYNDTKYFVTDKNIYTFDGTNWSEFIFPNTMFGGSYELRDIEVVNLNNIWIVSDGNGLMNWDGSNWMVYNTGNSNLPSNYFEDIAYDAASQTLWVVGTNQGLIKFDGTTWTTYNSANTPMADNDLRIVTLDNNGVVYTSTAPSIGNIEIWSFDGTTWTNIVTGTNAPQDAVRAIHFDKDNVLWAGVGDNLIYKYTNAGWTSWDLATVGLPGYRVYDITSDDLGHIYVGTYNGAASFDGTNWTVWTTANSGLSANRTHDLELDNNNKLWFATHHGISSLQLTITNTRSIITQNENIQVYPNPIVNNAIVEFTTIASTDEIRLNIISADGRIIDDRLISGNRTKGIQQITIQRGDLSSGIYYLSVRYNDKQMTKAILVK